MFSITTSCKPESCRYN
ncbi:hypothetical protein AB4238_20090 [Shewanella sp. 10N.286.45.A1]